MQYQFIDPQGAEGQHPADRNNSCQNLWGDSMLLPNERMIQVAAPAHETWGLLLSSFGNLTAHVEKTDGNHYLRATVFFDFEALQVEIKAYRSEAGLGILVLKQASLPNSVLFHRFAETLQAGLFGEEEPDSLWEDFSDFGDAFDDEEESWEARVAEVIRQAAKPVPATEKLELLRILAVWSESSPQSRPAIARGLCSAAGIFLAASSLLSPQESPSDFQRQESPGIAFLKSRYGTPNPVAELYPLAVVIKHAASVNSEAAALRSLLPILQKALAAPEIPELVARELLLAERELLQTEFGSEEEECNEFLDDLPIEHSWKQCSSEETVASEGDWLANSATMALRL
eukprot:CAMPEP_0115106526 /NCGR_PEP_ID=MMETSP0227-20121206/36717_1 /TAXON_ID=89957 /ORGANISM="Polarella glacialis, Strain CCMP 1383" /LENGTH=344 /DNA_ID=CAMNT_0002504159 /DNA_START=42 /DNA_END=1076 /DNA_ORIENTATION=-